MVVWLMKIGRGQRIVASDKLMNRRKGDNQFLRAALLSHCQVKIIANSLYQMAIAEASIQMGELHSMASHFKLQSSGIDLVMTSIFHKFIEVAASKPSETALFSEFAYMEHEIRKSYKQLKNSKGVEKPCEEFVDYWKQVGAMGREEQVTVYFRWIELIQKAISNYVHPELPNVEADLYVKKSIISKWEIRKVKLNGLVLQIFSKRLKQFPLKCFCIRKSKNKDHFSWVMEVVMQIEGSKYKLKSFHLGSNNVNEYQEWYREIENRIDMARIYYFKEAIDIESRTQMKGSMRQSRAKKEGGHNEYRNKLKTLTELVIDKELKNIEECEGLTIIQDNEKRQAGQEQIHPNIFVRIFPKLDLTHFCETPIGGNLLECEKEYSLYEVDGAIKIFITFGRSLSVVFRAISESHKNWNPEIDTFNIKNKISCENSIFAYQKDKSKGFLYRERDYFFLRHCFTLEALNKRERLFMIEKSIDSIHNPPFMTVARGEKELIWSVVGNRAEKESLLIVQGIIKGGGYMNASEDRQNTIKYFKKLLHLDNYMKQIQVSKGHNDAFLFRQDWMVSFKEDNLITEEDNQDQFYSPHEVDSDQFNSNNLERPNNAENIQQSVYLSPRQDNQSQFHEFIEQTNKEHSQGHQKMQNQTNQPAQSTDEFFEEYIAPDLNQDHSVIIPQKYLTKRHILDPKQKGKGVFAQKVRGHALWKGEWAVAQSGGLNYVDQQKMRQQKKVLTFIIKRIGKNILSGKGILNVSLPVDIFCRESNIERLALSFGFFPMYLEKVVNADPIEQLKAIIGSAMGSSHIYLTMEKPFNPILGETYQCWIDGCPVYFEQISHHPPIAAYLMKGRGYQIYGSVEAKMDLSINSGTGVNEGIFTIKFDSGRKFYYTTPPGQLSGLTYGERKLCMVDKAYFWSVDEGLFLEIVYNPQSKQSRFFSNSKTYVGEQKLADYFEGVVRKYNPADLNDFLTPKKKDSSKQTIIPKSLPPHEPLGQCGKVSGRWTKNIYFDKQKLFEVQTATHFKGHDEKYPLPSHSNFREDVVYRRLNEIVLSQEWKENLEVRQRRDRKLREESVKKKK